jgi:hypothetical protein
MLNTDFTTRYWLIDWYLKPTLTVNLVVTTCTN